jgi:hypothetical protein
MTQALYAHMNKKKKKEMLEKKKKESITLLISPRKMGQVKESNF